MEEIIKREVSYNPKIDYLICRSFSRTKFDNGMQAKRHHESYFKLPYTGETCSSEEHNILTVRIVYDCLKSITTNITPVYQLYDELEIIPANKRVVFESYFSSSEVPSANSLFSLIKNANKNYRFILLVFNAKRVKSNLVPIVFYPKDFDKLVENALYTSAFTSNSYFAKLFNLSEIKTNLFNKGRTILPIGKKDHLIPTLIKAKLLKESTKTLLVNSEVDKIILHGSTVTGGTDRYSDVDLNLFFTSTPTEETIIKVVKHLKVIFNDKVDVTISSITNDLDRFKTYVGTGNYLEINL